MLSKIERHTLLTEGTVTISAKWKGKSWQQLGSCPIGENEGYLQVGAVNLALKNLELISLRFLIPKTSECILHNCIILSSLHDINGIAIKTTSHEVMKLSIRQVEECTLRTIFFQQNSGEKSPQNEDLKVGNGSKKLAIFEDPRDIALKKEIPLKDGESYDLIFEADDSLVVTARLVSPGKQVSDNNNLSISKEHEELEKELIGSLKSVLEFLHANLIYFRCFLEGYEADIEIDSLDAHNRIDAVKGEIQKMQKDVLKTLVEDIQKLKKEEKKGKLSLEDEIAKLFIKSITKKGIQNIVMTSLRGSTKDKITPGMEILFKKQTSEFLTPYLEHLAI